MFSIISIPLIDFILLAYPAAAIPVYAVFRILRRKFIGLDHGVGHPLLLLYAVKAPNGQKINEFKALGHCPSDASFRTFQVKSNCIICITICFFFLFVQAIEIKRVYK